MMHLPASVRVYLCLSPCDMRRSFDGLHALVRDHLELDPFAGHLYLFANRRRDRLKIFEELGALLSGIDLSSAVRRTRYRRAIA